ncbi:class I SAM-dependent methyltransferase [bacterium]|nr:class I SAM-dependent methyltransferase [bacterium]
MIARVLRANVHQRLHMHFGAGQRILELGCGTGEDALHLAQRGVHVTATDASEAMRAQARAKTADCALVTVLPLDLQCLERGAVPGLEWPSFDGAFANFGPLNCLRDWRPLAQFLADVMRPGSVAGFAVMSPFCVWEMAWHGLHGDLRTLRGVCGGRLCFCLRMPTLR